MMWGGTKVEGVLNSYNITKLFLGNVNYVHYVDEAPSDGRCPAARWWKVKIANGA